VSVTFPQGVMLARSAERLPSGRALRGGGVYEPKWDGYRGLLFVTDAGVRVQSRRGADLTRAFPDIAAAARRALPPGVVLDGELVVGGRDGLDFGALQQRLTSTKVRAAELAVAAPATFMAFDMLALDDTDVRPRPLRERRVLLEALMADVSPPLQLTPQTVELAEAERWMRDYALAPVGVEGVVAKGAGDPYVPDRRGWVKVKIRDTADALVGAVVGTIERPQRLVLGRLVEGQPRIVGSTHELRPVQQAEVAALLVAADEHPWPAELSLSWGTRDRTPIVRVDPTVTVEVLADQAIDAGRWRHTTRFVRTRLDL
jgi:ATP-dependent DNA ligase